MRHHWKILSAVIVFALCIAPTIVSYRPYSFIWDDSDYLARSIKVSRAFWSGDKPGMRDAMVSIRPPMMTLLGVPWGPLVSWDAAGKAFVTLNTIVSFFAACCLFLLLRIGVKPFALLIPCVCLLAALGPFHSELHSQSTALLADCLFSWIILAALLLIPFETAAPSRLTGEAILRGALWGIIVTAGALTKASILYFIILILPVAFAIRVRGSGLRSAFIALGSSAVTCLPVTFYWLRYGLPALKNGWAASFGGDAINYYSPLSGFLRDIVVQSPGLMLIVLFAAGGIVYYVLNRRNIRFGTNIIPVLILLGYLTMVLATSNREIRYVLPIIVALPFLIAVLVFTATEPLPWRTAAISALLVFGFLTAAGIPMLHRPNRESFSRCEAVLALAVKSHAKSILLATDSPTLNATLMTVTTELSSPHPPIATDVLAWRIAQGQSMEKDLKMIQESDLVAFQDEQELTPAFTNVGFAEHEQYAKQHAVGTPVWVTSDVSVYTMHHDSQ